MRQNEKALILALISFLSLKRLCPKSAKFPQNPLFLLFFLWEILPRTSKCPRTPLFFLSENNALDQCPGPQYLAETAPDPNILYFSRQKILPWTSSGHRHPPTSDDELALIEELRCLDMKEERLKREKNDRIVWLQELIEKK